MFWRTALMHAERHAEQHREESASPASLAVTGMRGAISSIAGFSET